MTDVEKKCLRAFENGEKEKAARLLTEVEHPQRIKDGFGQSLVHFAAKNGWQDICKLSIEHYHCGAADEDAGGKRPLHCACAYGQVGVVNYLIKHPTVITTANDKSDWLFLVSGVCVGNALDMACSKGHLPVVKELLKLPYIRMPTDHLYSNKFAVLSLLNSKMEPSAEFPVRPRFPVFMTGNSGAGKTTLTTAMQQLSYDILLDSSHPIDKGMVSGIKPLTAGICPATCDR